MVNALAASKLAAELDARLGGKPFHAISYPAGFKYYFMNMEPPSTTNVYNVDTIAVIDRLLKIPADGSVVYGMDGSFSETFSNIMSTAKYVLSTVDVQQIKNDQEDLPILATAVVQSFRTYFGIPVVPDGMDDVTYCLEYYKTVLKISSANKIPDIYCSYRTAVLAYRIAAANSMKILDGQYRFDQRLTGIRANVVNPGPSATNGGLITGNGTTPTYGIGYNFPSTTEGSFWARSIEDTSGQNSVSVSFTVCDLSSSTSSVSMEGGPSVCIPIEEFFTWATISGGASSQKNLSSVTASSANGKITYNGVTAVSVAPTDLSAQYVNPTGWYDRKMLRQAVVHGKKDVTGIKLDPNTPQGQASYYGLAAGNFLRANTLLVSQLPVITMTFTGTNKESIYNAFQETVNISVNFLWFSVGSASQSYSVSTINVHSDGSTVDVTFGPPPPDPNIKNKDRVAFIMGGAIDAPPLFN